MWQYVNIQQISHILSQWLYYGGAEGGVLPTELPGGGGEGGGTSDLSWG